MHTKLQAPRDCTNYVISGTDSFRLGSRKLLPTKKADSVGRNFGGNRANLEKSMRKVWIADEGYTLCQVDQSGAEALIVAYLCEDKKYRSLFKNGIKPHTYLTLKLFSDVWKKSFNSDKVEQALVCTIPELKNLDFWKILSDQIAASDNNSSDKRYYHFGKKTIHAGSYGMRENTFRLSMLQESGGTINLSVEQASKFLVGFHTEFPEIQRWHMRVFEQAKSTKQLRNLFNFPFNITSYIDPNSFKDLIAWAPQSTVACITRQAFVNLQEYIEQNKKNWHLLHDTHDSYLAEAPDEEINDLALKMKEFIEIELTSPFDGSKFRMRSSVALGKNWAPYKESSNPDGMKEVKF